MAMKRIKLKILQILYQVAYRCFSLCAPYRKKRVVFVSNRSQALEGNLAYLAKEFASSGEYEVKVFVFHFRRSLLGRLQYMWRSFLSMYYLATAHFFILDDYFFPLYCLKKVQQRNIVVQLWHAIGTLKKFGLSIPKNREDVIRPHTNYDYVILNADHDKSAYLEAFDVLPQQLIVTGAPRMDYLPIVAQSVACEDEKPHKKRVLYAPTYRTGGEDLSSVCIHEMITMMTDLADEWDLYVSVHPYVTAEEADLSSKNVHFIYQTDELELLMPTFDLLITDYSSILLEYSYFERPILLYVPDLTTYLARVGFYVDYLHYVDAPYFTDIHVLKEFLQKKYPSLSCDNVLRLKKDNFQYDDGKNSKRAFLFLNGL